MKSKILKTFMFFILFSALLITASFAVEIKEDVTDYKETGAFIIGSTRFDTNKLITATMAANAGVNEAKLNYILYGDISKTKITTYQYTLFGEWFEIAENGGTRELTTSEAEELEENLNIFFENNVEKVLEIPFTEGTVDTTSIVSDRNDVTFADNKFYVPALTFEFKFWTAEGQSYEVETNVDTNIIEGKDTSVEKTDIIPSDVAISVGKEFFKYSELNENNIADKVKEAIAKSSPENPVKLWTDIQLGTSSIVFDSQYKDLNAEIDLNGWSIYGEGNYVIEFKAPNSILTIKNSEYNNGTYASINAIKPEKAGALKADSRNIEGTVILNIEEGVTVCGTDYGLVIFGDKTIANVKGDIEATNASGYAISGNGNPGCEGTTLNISGEADIRAYQGIGIYIPQEGITNISDKAYISGKTAIAMKAGTLNMTGGTLVANGEQIQIPAETNDGTNPTGDAIYVESNKGYAGNVKINIEGKETVLSSYNGYPVRVYKSNSNDDITITGKYSTAHIVSDKNIGYDEAEATMTVGNAKYGAETLSLAKAIMSSSKENPAKLLFPVWVDETINLKSTESFDAVLDLGNNSITGNDKYVIVLESPNSSLTIDNGTIYGNTYAGIKITSKDLTKDSTVTLNVGENASITGPEYGLIIFGNGYKSNAAENATLAQKATATANIKGTICALNEEAYAISGNGNENWGGTCINISGDKANVIAEYGVGIFLPQEGVANISGGTVTGRTAIGTKAGTLNITGGQLYATDSKISNEELVKDGNGIQITGDLIYVECNEGYADHVTINIDTELPVDEDSNVIRIFQPEGAPSIEGVTSDYLTASESASITTNAGVKATVTTYAAK